MTNRVYKVEIASYPLEACLVFTPDECPGWADPVSAHTKGGDLVDEDKYIATLNQEWEPDTESTNGWSDPKMGHKDFWWPRTGKVYQSRSAAQKRADLINGYGAKTIIYESDLDWTPVPVANLRRATKRRAARIAKLKQEIEQLEAAS